MANAYGDPLEDWENEIARQVVFKFVRGDPKLKPQADDLLQECKIHWWQVRGAYREGKGAARRTYMTRVLERLLINLLKAQKTDRRRINYEAVSLSDDAFRDEGSKGASLTIEETTPDATGEAERLQLGLKPELKVVLSQLSARQQKIADLGSQGHSKTNISKILGVNRSTVHEEIERIKEIFTDYGLGDYIQ